SVNRPAIQTAAATRQSPPAPSVADLTVAPEPQGVRTAPAPKQTKAEQKPTPIPSMEQPPELAPVEAPELKAVLLKALGDRVIQGRVTAVGDSQIEIQTKAPLQAGMAGVVVSRESKKPLARIQVTQAEGTIGAATIVKGEKNSILLNDAAVILFPPESDLRKQRHRLPAKARLEPIE
ncbi:MAG TPA: hypothetical protein VJ521_07630, partial [Acidobacteriota bacterium]|nr:hypothetical protein [Acidobacteriota bacterium]